MGAIRPVEKVKYFIGVLTAFDDLLDPVQKDLSKRFGPIDRETEPFPFTQTDSYKDEMGTGLKRRFLSLAMLRDSEDVAQMKVWTNFLEKDLAQKYASKGVKRPVNLDPGYLTLMKVVLATTRNAAHRVYLQQGIYGESTLQYSDGQWRAWPWTPPDYTSPEYLSFFLGMRQVYMSQSHF